MLVNGSWLAFDAVQIDLHETWWIRDVEIPTRLVLAPMAGVSVQAFRRQGRRYGAGLVCSEMVSCAGIEHRNERTLGYLRVAADEHPLAIQLFGSEPGPMAEAARMVQAAGADIVDLNFGCPVKKVTRTGAGATLLEDPDLAPRLVAAVAAAVDLPVSVKLRRGVANGSRACLELGPRLVEAGASSLTLHPRSAEQMYTGTADHCAHRRARVARRRTGRGLGGHRLAREGAGGSRDDRRGGRHGRARRAGQPVGAAGDRRRRRRRADARGSRGRARPVHPRDGPGARRAARVRVPQEVLRLVPRPRDGSRSRSSRSCSSSSRPRRSNDGCSRRRPARSSWSSGSRPRSPRATR